MALTQEWDTTDTNGQTTRLSSAGVKRHSKHSTVLHTAIWYGHREIVKYLLETSVNPNVADHEGNTALDIAIAAGNKNLTQPLIAVAGALTAIFEAVRRGRLDILTWLIEEESIDPHIRSGSYSLLAIAIEKDDVDCAKYLIGHNVKVYFTPHYQKLSHYSDGFHPLHAAAHYGSNKVVDFLLDELMVDINIVDSDNHNALFYACMNKRLSIAYTLVRKGIDASVSNWEDPTVLERLCGERISELSGELSR